MAENDASVLQQPSLEDMQAEAHSLAQQWAAGQLKNSCDETEYDVEVSYHHRASSSPHPKEKQANNR